MYQRNPSLEGDCLTEVKKDYDTSVRQYGIVPCDAPFNNRIKMSIDGKKYNVIYADPPWEYRHKVTGRGGRGAASHHYQTMTIDDLKKMKLPTDKDCFLWMWVTNPILVEGTATVLCKAWGFKPQSLLTWVKPGIGMGYTLRSATEHILVARKGKPIVHDRSVPTHFYAKRLRHSEKPEEARKIIEKICRGEMLELFARKESVGWDVFGNEVNGSIELPNVQVSDTTDDASSNVDDKQTPQSTQP